MKVLYLISLPVVMAAFCGLSLLIARLFLAIMSSFIRHDFPKAFCVCCHFVLAVTFACIAAFAPLCFYAYCVPRFIRLPRADGPAAFVLFYIFWVVFLIPPIRYWCRRTKELTIRFRQPPAARAAPGRRAPH